MKGRKPTVSRLKRAFIIAATVFGIGGGTAVLDNLPKDPMTDTQTISMGVNVSPSDQMWKHTLSMRSQDARDAAFMQAAQSGDSWRAQALFDAGINGRSGIAVDALSAAAYAGHSDVVDVMLRNGVDPTANDSAALVSAIRGGNDGIALRMLALGARADAQNNEALLLAAFSGNNSMVQTLLAYGADAAAHDSAALNYAQAFGYTDVAATLQTAIDAKAPAQTGPYLADDGGASPSPFSPWNYRGPGSPF